MKRAALATAATCLLVTACGDDPQIRSASVDGSARPAAPVTSAPASTAPSAPSEASDEPPFAADTASDEQSASGGPLSVTAIRVGTHDGYDRVVFELDGRQAGEPGWFVRYEDDPRQQGSGEPVELDGQAALAVRITGVGYPMDTGVEEQPDPPDVPRNAKVVQGVSRGSVFEGQHETFIGTSGKAPFRVFRLADPARVVIDFRQD